MVSSKRSHWFRGFRFFPFFSTSNLDRPVTCHDCISASRMQDSERSREEGYEQTWKADSVWMPKAIWKFSSLTSSALCDEEEKQRGVYCASMYTESEIERETGWPNSILYEERTELRTLYSSTFFNAPHWCKKKLTLVLLIAASGGSLARNTKYNFVRTFFTFFFF